jgi:hypothetical protein
VTAEQFAYWLNGFVELESGKPPTDAQWQAVKEHLATVFRKVTPPVSVPSVTPYRPAQPWDTRRLLPSWPWDSYPAITC